MSRSEEPSRYLTVSTERTSYCSIFGAGRGSRNDARALQQVTWRAQCLFGKLDLLFRAFHQGSSLMASRMSLRFCPLFISIKLLVGPRFLPNLLFLPDYESHRQPSAIRRMYPLGRLAATSCLPSLYSNALMHSHATNQRMFCSGNRLVNK